MFFQKIIFGPYGKNENAATDLVYPYLSELSRSGQTTGDSLPVFQDGIVAAYVNACGVDAWRKKFHSRRGSDFLKEIIAFFGQEPEWVSLQDIPWKRDITWKNAPFLCLTAAAYFCDRQSPVLRGDNGEPIPCYRLPLSDEDKFLIDGWQREYQNCDRVRVGSLSPAFQKSAYRLVADPASQLSKFGRMMCRKIESATGVPTYYYLLRWFGRKPPEEENRKCPGCGNAWRMEHPDDDFFPSFQCVPCRLISTLAHEVNARFAKIGEFSGKKAELSRKDMED